MSNLALHMQKLGARLAGRLQRVTQGLTELPNAALSPYDMHRGDFRALVHLFGSADKPAFPSELSISLAQTPANVTRIANLLVKRGLVGRTDSTKDRRRVELRITHAGRRFVLKLLPKFFPPLRKAFSCLSATDKRELQRLLQRLVKSMDAVISS